MAGTPPGGEIHYRRSRFATRLPTDTVISQGGLPDLEAGSERVGHPCGTEAPAAMLGDRPELTSPPRMPFGTLSLP